MAPLCTICYNSLLPLLLLLLWAFVSTNFSDFNKSSVPKPLCLCTLCSSAWRALQSTLIGAQNLSLHSDTASCFAPSGWLWGSILTLPYSEQTSLKADVIAVSFCMVTMCLHACSPSQILNPFPETVTNSLGSACYLLQTRQQLNICSMNYHLLCPRWSDFCFLFVLFLKRF